MGNTMCGMLERLIQGNDLEGIVAIFQSGYTSLHYMKKQLNGYTYISRLAGESLNRLFDMAAAHGRTHILRYAVTKLRDEEGFMWKPHTHGNMSTICAGAANGHVSVLELVAELCGVEELYVCEHCAGDATPAYVAAQSGHLNVLRYLQQHVPPERRGFDGVLNSWQSLTASSIVRNVKRGAVSHCPAVIAAANNHIDALRFLAEHAVSGSDVLFTRQNGLHRDSPLEEAAKNGHLECVEYLMSAAPRRQRHDTPSILDAVCAAAQNGHLHVLQYLTSTVRHGDRLLLTGSSAEGTALCWAVKAGHTHVVEYILEHCKGNQVNELLLGGDTIHPQDSLLMLASQRRHLETLKCLLLYASREKLLAHDVEANAATAAAVADGDDDDDRRVDRFVDMLFTIARSCENAEQFDAGIIDMVRFMQANGLLGEGGSIWATLALSSHDGYSDRKFAHYAAACGSVHFLELVVQAEIAASASRRRRAEHYVQALSVVDNWFTTPLMLAASNNQLEFLKHVVECVGGDASCACKLFDAVDKCDRSWAFYAVRADCVEVLKYVESLATREAEESRRGLGRGQQRQAAEAAGGWASAHWKHHVLARTLSQRCPLQRDADVLGDSSSADDDSDAFDGNFVESLMMTAVQNKAKSCLAFLLSNCYQSAVRLAAPSRRSGAGRKRKRANPRRTSRDQSSATSDNCHLQYVCLMAVTVDKNDMDSLALLLNYGDTQKHVADLKRFAMAAYSLERDDMRIAPIKQDDGDDDVDENGDGDASPLMSIMKDLVTYLDTQSLAQLVMQCPHVYDSVQATMTKVAATDPFTAEDALDVQLMLTLWELDSIESLRNSLDVSMQSTAAVAAANIQTTTDYDDDDDDNTDGGDLLQAVSLVVLQHSVLLEQQRRLRASAAASEEHLESADVSARIL